MKNGRVIINVFGILVSGFLGILLVAIIEKQTIATELILSIAFLINILAIYNKSLSKFKNKIRQLTASFLLGALLGVIFV